MSGTRKGTLIAGDGIGPEVVSAAVRVLEATGVSFEWDSQMAGAMAAATEGTPALFNDPKLTEQVATILKNRFGEDNVLLGEPVMGGEDFGRFGKAGVPICMLRLGAVSQKRLDEFAARHQPPNSLHSPLFYPDIEETLVVGVPALAYVAMDLLKPGDSKASAQ